MGVGVINYYPGPLSPFKEETKLGKGDVTLDMFGWNQVNDNLKTIIREDNPTIISSKWYPAAHIDYYVARPNNWRLITLGKITDTHKYEEISHRRGGIKRGDNAYFIAVSNYFTDPEVLYDDYFESIEVKSSFQVFRLGEPVKNVRFIR